MPSPLESIAAKGAAKAAGVRARANGLTGVFNLLAQEHAEAAKLLDHAKSTDDPAKREDLWSEIRRQLLAHERAELTIVYPVLEANPATSDISRRHSEEAQSLETAIEAIDALGFASENWRSSVEKLISLIEAHVHDEETQFFPQAIDALGKKAASALEGPFKAAREQLLANSPSRH